MYKDCVLDKEVWAKVQAWWRINNCDIVSMDDFFRWLEEATDDCLQGKAPFAVGCATVINLWRNQNDATFQSQMRRAADIFALIQRDSLLWIDSKFLKVVIDGSVWLFSPRLTIKPM